MAMLLLLSVLVLLTQPPSSRGAEVKTLSRKPLIDACTLVMCSPVENGLPGRDGRDGRDGPRGEKGDPGASCTFQAGPWFWAWRGNGAQSDWGPRSTLAP